MAYPFTLDDVRFLASPAGAGGAAGRRRVAADRGLSLLADLTRLRRTVGERAAAVAETVRLRRRAVAKLGATGARWLFTDESLQQATPAAVAAHRAGRLAGLGVHDLTCSIGTDVAAPGRGLPAGDRLRSRSGAGADGAAQPERCPVVPAGWWWPTRLTRILPRTAGLRRPGPAGRHRAADHLGVHGAHRSPTWMPRIAHRPPVLRLPPGIDYDALHRPGEVEIVSLDGGAREAVLWPAELAAGPAAGRRCWSRPTGPGSRLVGR